MNAFQCSKEDVPTPIMPAQLRFLCMRFPSVLWFLQSQTCRSIFDFTRTHIHSNAFVCVFVSVFGSKYLLVCVACALQSQQTAGGSLNAITFVCAYF